MVTRGGDCNGEEQERLGCRWREGRMFGRFRGMGGVGQGRREVVG